MLTRPWQRELTRRIRGGGYRRRQPYPSAPRPGQGGGHPVLVTLLVGLMLAGIFIQLLEGRLRPVVSEIAQTQAQNKITSVLEHTIMDDLSQRRISYADLVTIQRDNGGNITSLTTDMASLNLLRAELVAEILTVLNGVDVSVIQIPLGSLFNSELVWARGPALKARAMSVGTISAEFESEFSSSGVNQTLHRIWLELSIPLTVLLPGGGVAVPIHTRLCVAETVIVGKVPETYFSFGAVPGV